MTYDRRGLEDDEAPDCELPAVFTHSATDHHQRERRARIDACEDEAVAVVGFLQKKTSTGRENVLRTRLAVRVLRLSLTLHHRQTWRPAQGGDGSEVYVRSLNHVGRAMNRHDYQKLSVKMIDKISYIPNNICSYNYRPVLAVCKSVTDTLSELLWSVDTSIFTPYTRYLTYRQTVNIYIHICIIYEKN